jgi:hypothetical protein
METKKLIEYEEITLSLDARLLFDIPNKQQGFDPSLHAARFPIAIAVRNTLSNNTFWLILVVYDDRYPESGLNCLKCITQENGEEQCKIPQQLDAPGRWECPFDGSRWSKEAEKKGTWKMLFRVPTRAFAHGDIASGEWTRFEADLLPYIEAGIEAARQTSHLGGFSEGLRFYDLTFISLGWEITGLNQAAMAVRNLSLNGVCDECR